MIQAKIVADSLSPQGDRLTSVLATFPRIILAEVKTHRILKKLDENEGVDYVYFESASVNDTPELSKNTSSSRAIPFHKMLKEIKDNPFIPMAFQKHHSGMQGTEYLDPTIEYNISDFLPKLLDIVSSVWKEDEENNMSMQMYTELLSQYDNLYYTPGDWWLFARDRVIEAAILLHCIGVSKQLCNRLLEPFMWTTMLITGTKEGWDNFFNLRCPVYEYGGINFKSKNDCYKHFLEHFPKDAEYLRNYTYLDWLQHNKGQAEIHMMDLAEKIYDAFEESTPKQLQAGEWHIPFEDQIVFNGIMDHANYDGREIHVKSDPEGSKIPQVDYIIDKKVKISVAMAARTSYTIVGEEKEIDYSKLVDLHDRLIAQNPPHSSPMEHCAVAMDDEDYNSSYRGEGYEGTDVEGLVPIQENLGWCKNFRGFIPYRHLIESN